MLVPCVLLVYDLVLAAWEGRLDRDGVTHTHVRVRRLLQTVRQTRSKEMKPLDTKANVDT